MRMGGQRHAPAALPPGKGPGTHCAGGWVGPGPIWTVRKISLTPGFNPRTVQPVASHYTDYAITGRDQKPIQNFGWKTLMEKNIGKT
jgi:hypothetical protein